MRILIIEDEAPLRVAVADSLKDEGYRVLQSADGAHGLRTVLEQSPDLILLDVMLPKLDGFALCQELRRQGRQVPVLMLTAKGLVDDRVAGLDAGADDYLVKPFSLVELHARIRALLRRIDAQKAGPAEIQLGKITVRLKERQCLREGVRVPLTAKEFGVLQLLIQHMGEAISRDRFLDEVWGYTAFPSTRTVDNHIAKLRAKIEDDPNAPQWIITVPKVGYRLNPPS